MDNKRPYIGVDAIIFNESNEVLLIHRTGKNFYGYWGLVSGMVEWNEDILTALKREVKEEIGVEITECKFTGKYYDKIGRHPTKTVICLPHICKIKGKPKCISECDEIKWYKKSELYQMNLAYDHKQMLIDIGFLTKEKD